MQFRIADTFTGSLARLTGDEQKAVKTTAFDLQLNPANPGMQFHKLDKARDKNFWSVRVNADVRLIVHKTAASLLLCYVDHHDKAYHWAERRKLETHPTTGAAQLVEIRETVREIAVPKYVEVEPTKMAALESQKLLFAGLSEEELLAFGVPAEWIDDVHRADEDSLFELAEHLPHEAAEALLCLATGETPRLHTGLSIEPEANTRGSTSPAWSGGAFDHPDALRRFRIIANSEELALALNSPWEKWAVFLHPAQRDIVERRFNGAARVAGSAGTGKTIVAIHRAARLAENNPESRVLLTTFSETLAAALTLKLRLLLESKPRVLERIEVQGIAQFAQKLFSNRLGKPKLVDDATLRSILADASSVAGVHRFTGHFIETEWREIVDAWQVETWDAYKAVPRLGRKTRLGEAQRQTLWRIFETTRASLAEQGLLTGPMMYGALTHAFLADAKSPYDFVIVDEAQDIGVPELRLLAAMTASQPDGLFFAGDLGQRIFQPPFSWKSLGVDVRGRSQTLRINYRTSHQIRSQADRLLSTEIRDVDGNVEDRSGTVSAFNGVEPIIRTFQTSEAEIEATAEWIKARIAEGLSPQDFGVIVRSEAQFTRGHQAIEKAGLAANVLPRTREEAETGVALLTMHVAKGMEFRAVAVMACDDEVIPLQERIAAVADDADLEDVYNTERHLLYVACTRARDHLHISGVAPASEFIDDLTAAY